MTVASDITLRALSEKNLTRSDSVWPQCREWSVEKWLMAALGELGEAANIAKKMERDGPTPELLHAFHREMVDLLNYCDLTITMTGGSTQEVCRDKWNEVSERVGYSLVRL